MGLGKIGGGIGGVVIVAILFFVRMGANDAKVEEFGQDTKAEFIQLISQAEVCKGDQRNYVEWLAGACHEECWKNNYELEYVSRRRSDVVVDAEGYTRDMLSAMMEMARRENAPHIAEGLGTFYAALFPIE
jgi:hypothetical protein